jgi:hypothetical protein
LETRKAEDIVSRSDSWRADGIDETETDVPAQQSIYSTFLCLFCSLQAFNRLVDTHLHWRGLAASLLIQMLICSANTLIHTPRNPEITFKGLPQYSLAQSS